MLALALQDCVAEVHQLDLWHVSLLLCVAEPERPGRLAGLDDSLLADLQTEASLAFHPHSQVIAEGRVSGIEAFSLNIDALVAQTERKIGYLTCR